MSRKKTAYRNYQLLAKGNDDNKIDLDRIIGAITGEQDPLRFPISYPAIDFDPATKKTIIQSAFIIAAGIAVGSVLRGMASR